MDLKSQIPNFIFLFFIQMLIISAIGQMINPDWKAIYFDMRSDEKGYQNIIQHWKSEGIDGVTKIADTKPLTFLLLQRLLKADETYLYTRIFNFILVFAVSYLIFDLTKRKEAFLFILIPLFLNAMWLTDEIIESFFILLSFRFAKQSGLWIGIATLFRPYALLYTILIEKKQWIWVFGLGAVFSIYLLSQDAFFPYLFRLIHYPIEARLEDDWVGLSLMIPLVYLAWQNKDKTIFNYGLLACVPLLIHLWSHYLMTPYVLFYLSWLSSPKTTILN